MSCYMIYIWVQVFYPRQDEFGCIIRLIYIMSNTILDDTIVPILDLKLFHSDSLSYSTFDGFEKVFIETRESSWVLDSVFQDIKPKDIVVKLVYGTLVAKCRLAETDQEISSCSGGDI